MPLVWIDYTTNPTACQHTRCSVPLQNADFYILFTFVPCGIAKEAKPVAKPLLCGFYVSGFMVGKRSTSLIEGESVRSITSLSTPKPRPPVGGIPYSRAVT